MRNLITILFLVVIVISNAQTNTQLITNGNFEDSILSCSYTQLGSYINTNCALNLFNDCGNLPTSAYSGTGFLSFDLVDHRDSLLYNRNDLDIGTLITGFPAFINFDAYSLRDIIVRGPLNFYLKQNLVPNCNYDVNYSIHPYISDSIFCENLFDDSIKISIRNYLRNYYLKNINGVFTNNSLNGRSFKTIDTLNNVNYGYFNSTTQYYGSAQPLDTLKHIKGTNTNFYDTDTWYSISDTFMAENNYSIFQIGNFDLYSNLSLLLNQNINDSILFEYLDPVFIDGNWFYPDSRQQFIRARYYFDNISILPIGFEDLTLNLGPDTNLCNGAININAFEPRFEHYLWNTGDTTPNINITQGGTYILEADYGCGKLIDSIIVAQNPPDSMVNATDTLYICPNDLPFSLSANQNYTNLYWSTGDTAQSISITTEGFYTAYLDYFCLTVSDPTYIKILQNPTNLISFSDTIVCANFNYSLIDTFSTYSWSNGSNNNNFSSTQSGTFWVQAETNCFSFKDTFSVTIENLEIGSGIQTLNKCPNDFPIILQASFTAPFYNWTTADTSKSILVSAIKKDTVSVNYSNVCGLAENTFYINILPDYLSEPVAVLQDSCTEKNYFVVSVQNTDGLATYLWNNQMSGFSYLGENETVILYAFTACQNFEQQIEIPRCPEQIKFALPTAFSPNQDGVNDVFGLLYLNQNYDLEYFEVYNRWGEKIFYTENKKIFWDGKYKETIQEIGNYIYKLKLKGIDEIYNGSVQLIR